MKLSILVLAISILGIAQSASAVTSEDHFESTNNFLATLAGTHSLSGSNGCESIVVTKITENDRFNYHVGRRTYNIVFGDKDLHPASFGEDKQYTKTPTSFESNRRWLGRGGFTFFEKLTYKFTTDGKGNITYLEHQIIRKKNLFSKPFIFEKIECKL